MSSISAISNTVIRRTIPFCSHKFPIISKISTYNNNYNNIIINIQSQKSLQPPNYGHLLSLESRVINFQAIQTGRFDPLEHDPSGSPPEFPPVDPAGDSPEIPPLFTSPETDPGGAPPEVRENPPPYGPEPTPEIEFPTPPVGPPPGPDVPPMPPGPDITPPGPEIDPPRPPLPDVPPLRPPGPEIVPPPTFPPDIKPPPGSPFGDFGF